MANRYWVGGTASWDGTAGTKWSTTSGGAGGASVPTTADDVFFDSASTGTVIIATGNIGAKSINCTGFAGTLDGTAGINVAGGITFASGMTLYYSGTITVSGAGTLITAGKTLNNVTINAAGATVTLGDALRVASILNVTQGTLDTAGYNLTAGSLVSNSFSSRGITLNSSTVTLTNASALTFANVGTLTFNVGTSRINIDNANGALTGGGLSFYDVAFTNFGIGTRSLGGASILNNLSVIISLSGLGQLSLGSDIVVNGTFTFTTSSPTIRGFVRSSIIGTTRTLTCAAIATLADVDFRDVTIAGPAAPIVGTRLGDCGGNSGIVFPSAKTVYRVGTTTTWAGSSSWALTSGGTGSNNNFPLAQDTAVIDNSTALSGTLSLLAYNIGTLDASTRTTGITLDHNAPATFYGPYTLGSGVTVSGTSNQTFSGRGTMVFTSTGKTITFRIVVDAPGSTFQLGDAYSASNTITHTRGTFDANDYNLTCSTFSSSNNNTRTVTMGFGLWTLSGTGTVWDFTTINGLTFNKGTANIFLSSTSTTARTFNGGGLSYNKLIIGGTTGTSITTIIGANSFTELTSTKAVAHTVRFGANQGTIGTWSITGSAGNFVTVNSSVAGTRRTFNLTNVTSNIDYLSVRDIGVNQTNRFYVGANSTNVSNNLNVIFTAAPTLTATGNFFMLFN